MAHIKPSGRSDGDAIVSGVVSGGREAADHRGVAEEGCKVVTPENSKPNSRIELSTNCDGGDQT
ncbi:hypothetical protein FNV43_RR08580 [Rhamnella rubrinervis]|uniref:Uncharacterized protein n=1 Tax=Rhamnella rubrinervis TaxID=2594499 RepID=A0A8K0MIX0_9ROSA|nr:hypothetical protein FNV43_RR08580 [Rhamnella rubrinervis]